MNIFELIFILGVLCSAAAVLFAAFQFLRGRRHNARRTLTRLAMALTAYLAIMIVVSLATPQRILPQGEARCFDEWCLSVDRVTGTDTVGSYKVAYPVDVLYLIDVRISSRSRGRPQREVGVELYLLDSAGRRYDPDPEAERALAAAGRAGEPLDHVVNPGESFIHRAAFRVPAHAHGLGLAKSGSGPGVFIIGDDASLFHKRTVMRWDGIESNGIDAAPPMP